MKDRPSNFSEDLVNVAAEIIVEAKEQSKVHGKIIRPDFTLDILRRELIIGDRREALTGKQVYILDFLCSSPGVVQSHKDIYRGVWGEEPIEKKNEVEAMIVRVHISRIKRKLVGPEKTGPSPIKNLRGVGYLMVAPEDIKS